MTKPLQLFNWRTSLALIALLSPATAVAQGTPLVPLAGEPPTNGVRLTAPTLVRGDASALEVNPGALGMADAWSFHFQHAEMLDDGRVPGTGDGFFLATPLPLVRALVLGAGFQWLRPIDAMGYADSVKLSFGLGIRPSRALSLGLTFHTFIADDDPALDAVDTVDLGLVLRPTQWLAVGLAVRDLTTPLYADLPLQRVYDLELAFRPLLTRRLELAAAVRIGERRGDFDPRFRLGAEPLAGLRLVGDLELLQRDFDRDGDETLDLRATVGLEVNFEHVALGFSTTLGRDLPRAAQGPLAADAAGSTFQGMSVSLNISGANREPLIDTTRHLLHLELSGDLNQHRMTRLAALFDRIVERDDVTGILLEVDDLACGWGQAQELRAWIKQLRRRGKQTYAYLRAPSARQYYIAAAAEQVWLDPDGGIRLAGLAVQALYLRGFLDLLGVGPEFVKIAEYKSAPETFTRKGASGPAARMRESLLDDLYAQVVADLASDRHRRRPQLRALIDRGPFTSADAEKERLVDELVPADRLKRQIQRRSLARLSSASAVDRQPERWPVGPALAVVVLEGDIVRGKSETVPLLGRQVVGDETIVGALQWAKGNSQVKAIVLRINSPGGSAQASARIWRAVREANKRKPVLVSLADVAASGGYYAAAGGGPIYAQPATITGSIGIFTGKFEFSGLMRKLGLTSESSQRGKRALMDSPLRPFSEAERKFIRSRLTFYYDKFVRAVAEGRKRKPAAIDKVARGRVWTGRQAKDKNLIDRHGSLIDALHEAKRRAGIDPRRRLPTYVLPRPPRSLASRVLKALGLPARQHDAQSPLPAAAREALRGLAPVLLRARSGEPLARLPYELVF